MGFFKNWKEKRKSKKEEGKELKRPANSYDIYNQHETVTLQTNITTESNKKANSSKTKEIKSSNTKTTTINKNKEKGDSKMAEKKGRNIYYVSVRKDKDGKKLGWEVKKENADKITKLCQTKEEAIAFVKEKAGNQGSTCIIRKVDGSIQQTIKFE